MSSWYTYCERDLRDLLGMPDDWAMAALVAVGYPQGGHGPVRRRDVSTVTAVDHWDTPLIP